MQLIDGRPVYSATDLVGFLECGHLTDLELGALGGHTSRPQRVDPELDRIRKRGEQHEERYLRDLEHDGRAVTRLKLPGGPWEGGKGERYREAAERTREAIARGDDVIYQACFFDGPWLGFADFLLRRDPEPGQVAPLGWLYEVADTKLARHAKASALLQMCGYTEALTAIQGVAPLRMHVVLGGSTHETATFRVADHMAYYRAVKARFEAAVAGEHPWPPATYPEPVEHCDVCRWDEVCRARRRRDDHLSLVAGIATRTRQELGTERAITTRRGLAALPLPVQPLTHTKPDALTRVREQARIQVQGEDQGRPLHELLDPPRLRELTEDGRLVPGPLEPDKGLLALPTPSEGDLFLDLEGDPFALDDGVDYLFGILEPRLADPTTGGPVFHAVWSLDEGEVTLAAERRAFEQVIDLIMDRLERDPNLHVYHYAPYEPTALKRLMGRYATREEEVDRLLRGRVLVDLYRVVRQGLRASVESYSIKKLEPLYGFEREAELRAAGESIAMFEEWLELGGAPGDDVQRARILDDIARYNRDDVLSTWKLRDWLESLRPRLEADMRARGWLTGDLPRATAGEPEPTEKLADWLVEVQDVSRRLTEGLDTDVDPSTLEGRDHARWLLAQLLTWHRREAKAAWWRYFHLLLDLTDEERVTEPESIGMLDLVGPVDGSGLLFRYTYPDQEHAIKPGSVVDPRTRKSVTVDAIDDERHEVVLRHVRARAGIHPRSLVPNDIVPTREQERSLLRIGRWAAEHGIDADAPGFRAARDLLLRAHPRIGQAAGEALGQPGEAAIDAARRLVLTLDRTTLPIQGPPGSGKTHAGARMIVDLVAQGQRVGVTANSHKVIGNLLDEVARAAGEDLRSLGREIRIGQKPGAGEDPTCAVAMCYPDNQAALSAIAAREVDVLGGTAWLWAREDFTDAVDVLFIDEAGQFSLANAVCVSPAASSMVLLGDPQQLDQPTQGTHPPGAERSALAHILQVDGIAAQTMPPDRGLFLERTWRMHPSITRFTSELFYEDRLDIERGNERQALVGAGVLDGVGIRWVPVTHAERDDTDSADEADAVASMAGELLSTGATWTDRLGVERALTQADILVVAPYNDHRVALEEALAARGCAGVRVGTVDKFQGQQAPISIYTMASSSADDAPHGMEFLYSLNRLNVATSRARCLTAVVASPELIRVRCKTPRQMQLANALCRLVEIGVDLQPTRPAAPAR